MQPTPKVFASEERLAAAKSTFNFMKELPMFATLAADNGG